MANSENELNVNLENQFFGNESIPYCIKAGMIAVLSHATVGYHKKDGHDVFMAMLFDKDSEKEGKSSRSISGTMSFTFGVPASMGKDNCSASIKKFVELYPAVGDILEHIADNAIVKSDEDVCNILADASAKRFIHSPEGVVNNFEKFVSGNFDAYKKQTQSHYPGVISNELFDNLKKLFEDACKKKTIVSAHQMA